MNKQTDSHADDIQPSIDSADLDQVDLSDSSDTTESVVEKSEIEQEQFIDGFEQEFQDESGRRKTRKRRKLFCFNCNRPEGHFLAGQYRWFHSYIVGLTFGLIKIVGPYQCQCCGVRRLMIMNWLNPRYWISGFQGNVRSSSRRNSRR